MEKIVSKSNKFFFLISLFFPNLIYYRSKFDTSNLTAYLSIISITFIIYAIFLIKKKNKIDFKNILPFIVLFISGSIVSFIRDFPIIDIINRALPILFFICGYILISLFLDQEKNYSFLINSLFYLLIISAIYKYFFAISYYGLQITETRYQIIPSTFNMILCFFISSFIVKYMRFKSIICIVLFILITIISATRGLMLVGLSVFFFSIIIKNNMKLVKSFATFIVFILLIILLLNIFGENFYIQKFFDRLFFFQQYGFDPTFNTRFFEINYHISLSLKNLTNFIFGHGFLYPILIEDYNLNYSGEITLYQQQGFGHNLYSGLIFVSGFIIGSFCIYFLINSILKIKLKNLLQYLNDPKVSLDEKFLFIFGYLTFLAYLIYNFTGVTFGDKASSLYFGISYGLISLLKKKIKKEQINNYEKA
jgi:hypothetical protein